MSSWPRDVVGGTTKIISDGSIPLKINGKPQKAMQCCDAARDGSGKKSYYKLTCFYPVWPLFWHDSLNLEIAQLDQNYKKTGTCYCLISALAKSSLLKSCFSHVDILKHVSNVIHAKVRIL